MNELHQEDANKDSSIIYLCDGQAIPIEIYENYKYVNQLRYLNQPHFFYQKRYLVSHSQLNFFKD